MVNEVIIGIVIVVAFYFLSSRIKHLCNMSHNQQKHIVEEKG